MKTRPPRISKHLQASLAHNVAHWRKRRRMSQTELAYEADVSEATVGKIERGRADPQLSTLESIAAAMHVDMGDLISREWMHGDRNAKV